MNITKGKWEVFEPENILSGRQSIAIQAINGNETTSIIVWRESWVGDQETPQQRLADAQLIAEAGTVTNETGYTPRQLAEQKAELLEVLTLIINDNYENGSKYEIRPEYRDLSERIIKKLNIPNRS